MTSPAAPSPHRRTAMAALDAARPLITRLDARAHPEEVAADLIESWQATETSLRALLGGTSLAGQNLVGEARRNGLLEYPHAHALLEFLAARDRVSRPDYTPSTDDVTAARSGFQALEAALGVGIAANTGLFPAVSPGMTPPYGQPVPPPLPPSRPERFGGDRGSTTDPAAERFGGPAGGNGAGRLPDPRDGRAADPLPPHPVRRRRPRWLPLALAGLVALLAIVAVALWARGRDAAPEAYAQGVEAYRAGQREAARARFQQAAREAPDHVPTHVFLARLAREDGDLARAASELELAIRADTGSALAYREMGQLQLQAGRPDLAVRFLERSISRDQQDRVAQGWMACALSRQGNADLAQRFYQRAGSGDWDACRAAVPGAPGGVQGVPGGVPGGLPGAPGMAPPPGALPPRS
jgi:predicted negative regulator of RcsB-dependent stress response